MYFIYNILHEKRDYMDNICGWHIANSILKKSFDEENYITFTKLNCLTYLLCSLYLYLNINELINERFEKTELGPVLPSIYSKFHSFGNRVITKYAKDIKGKTRGIYGANFDECLSSIWEKFKDIDDATILSYIERGYSYSRREEGEILTKSDMLMDEIIRKERELEKAKSYIKKFNK